MRKRSCAHCTTWSSDECAVQESCFLKFNCDDGDGDDAHGSVQHDFDSQCSPI